MAKKLVITRDVRRDPTRFGSTFKETLAMINEPVQEISEEVVNILYNLCKEANIKLNVELDDEEAIYCANIGRTLSGPENKKIRIYDTLEAFNKDFEQQIKKLSESNKR